MIFQIILLAYLVSVVIGLFAYCWMGLIQLKQTKKDIANLIVALNQQDEILRRFEDR